MKKYIYKDLFFSVCCFAVVICLVPSITKAASLDFGEVEDFNYVIIGSNSVFDTDEITFEAWIKPTSLPTGTYIYEGRSTIVWNGDQSSGKDPYIFYINEFGKLEAHVDFESSSGLFIYGSTVLTLDTWHHVALTISPTKIQLFLNGYKDGEIIHDRGPAVKGHSYLAIGRHMWYKNPFGGLMDEIRIWSVAKTEEEIQKNMWAGKVTGAEENLVGYWDFEPGSDLNMLYDLTTNHNNGTIYGATWSEENAPVTMADILKNSGILGKGIDNAPGLQKAFNPNSKAAERAGKKK